MDQAVTDPQGRAITLHDRTWFGHILPGHPEMKPHRNLVEQAIANPITIRQSNADADCQLYFGAGPRAGIMVLVVVDVAIGLVKTAHLARRVSGGA